MPVKEILRIGHPLLLQTAQPVSQYNTQALNLLVQDLLDTMAAKDGVGLAAPQIGSSLKIVVFGMEDNPRYPGKGPIPATVLINPVIEPLSEEVVEDWEGCLSIPGMRGMVPRYAHIRYFGYDQYGAPINQEAYGFHARIVQHETDHLDGVLYPQRMTDLRRFGFIEELFPERQANGSIEGSMRSDSID